MQALKERLRLARAEVDEFDAIAAERDVAKRQPAKLEKIVTALQRSEQLAVSEETGVDRELRAELVARLGESSAAPASPTSMSTPTPPPTCVISLQAF